MQTSTESSAKRFDAYELLDRYFHSGGRVFLTGTQAIARIAFDQARRDRGAGLKTAGFISGYRGSPLGGLDLELWRGENFLPGLDLTILAAVNEELAATAGPRAQKERNQPHRTVHRGL